LSEEDVLITAENMYDREIQDLIGMEAVLCSDEFNMDFAPDPIQTQKRINYNFCKCGNIVFESPANQFRCGCCGNIKYDKKGV